MKQTNLILILLIIYAEASSQIVNVESSRMQSDTVGWKGGVGAGVSLTQNTEKIFQLNLEAQLQYKTSRDRGIWMILGNLGLLKIGGDRFVSDDLIHIRYNKKVNEWLRWEVFGQYQNNIVTQIDSRTLFGTGPRFKPVSYTHLTLPTSDLV